MTKNAKALNWFKRYQLSHKTNIFECYERPSTKKVKVFEYYKRLERENKIKDIRILSYSSQAFTLAYQKRVRLNGTEVFELIIETSHNTYSTGVYFTEDGTCLNYL